MSEVDTREMPLERLWWLADAPLFIDEHLVASFYDAVVRPEFELRGKTIGTINETTRELLIKGSGEASLGLPSFLSTVVPEAKARIAGEIEKSKGGSSQSSSQYEWTPVRTAGRKLEELTLIRQFSAGLNEA